MAVNNVCQREIVEVNYRMPEGGNKPHPACVEAFRKEESTDQ